MSKDNNDDNKKIDIKKVYSRSIYGDMKKHIFKIFGVQFIKGEYEELRSATIKFNKILDKTKKEIIKNEARQSDENSNVYNELNNKILLKEPLTIKQLLIGILPPLTNQIEKDLKVMEEYLLQIKSDELNTKVEKVDQQEINSNIENDEKVEEIKNDLKEDNYQDVDKLFEEDDEEVEQPADQIQEDDDDGYDRNKELNDI